MNRKISETIRVDQGFAPVDIVTAQTSVYLSMENYRQIEGVVTTNTVAQTKNVTIQLFQAKNAAGLEAKALTGVVTSVAPTGGAKLTVVVEADASRLDEGFTHVAAKVTSDNGAALLAAAVLIRANGRFGTSRP